jgi:hypothetical protein
MYNMTNEQGKRDYLNKPTLLEKFSTYKQSDDFKRDFERKKDLVLFISELYDEPAPSNAEIVAEVLQNKLKWLENYQECEQHGHEFVEQTHDDGSSEEVCWRCNETMSM